MFKFNFLFKEEKKLANLKITKEYSIFKFFSKFKGQYVSLE